MMAGLYVNVVLLAFGVGAVLSAEECSPESITQCLTPLNVYRSTLEDTTNIISDISDGIALTFCRIYNENVIPCFEENCGEQSSEKYENYIAVFKYLCVDQFAVYKRNKQCLASPEVHEGGRVCNWVTPFNFNMDTFKPDWSSYDAQRICQNIKGSLTCVEGVVYAHCGREAADWQRGFNQALQAPQTTYLGCSVKYWSLGGRSASSPCSKASIEQCTAPLDQYKLGEGGGVIPNYPASTMGHICQAYRGVRTCIEKFEDDCLHIDKAFLQGIHAKYRYICDTHFAGFVQQLDCLTDPSVLQRGSFCNSTLLLNARTDVNRCGHFEAYVGCRSQNVKKLCGSQAAAWVQGLDEAALGPLLSLTHCTLDISQKDHCVNLDDFAKCRSPLEIFGATNASILSYPVRELQTWCMAHEHIWPCIDTLLGNCDPDHRLVSEARLSNYKYLCDEHFNDFLRHKDCLSNEKVRSNTLKCPHNLYYGNSGGSITVCNNVEAYLSCVPGAVSPVCGEEAAELLTGEARAYARPLATKYGCVITPPTTGPTTVVQPVDPKPIIQEEEGKGPNMASIIVPVVLILLILLVLAAVGGVWYWKRRAGGGADLQADDNVAPPAQTVVYDPSTPSPVDLDLEAGGAAAAIPPDLVPPPYSEKEATYENFSSVRGFSRGYAPTADEVKLPLPPDYETLPDVASPADVQEEEEGQSDEEQREDIG